MYVVVLSNKKRVLTKTEKHHWQRGNYTHMMMKVKAAIHGKVNDMSINLHTPSSKAFLTSDWPWKYRWLSMHHEVNKILLDGLKARDEKMRRNDTILDNKSKKTKPWEEGEDFTDPQAKYRAKNSVLAEIEVRSFMQIKKAHTII